MPERTDDAIAYSKKYLSLFPTETDPCLNIARAYGMKYCKELRCAGKTSELRSENRLLALSNLKDGLQGDPDFAEQARTKYAQKGKAFECLLHDNDFRELVRLPPETRSDSLKGASGNGENNSGEGGSLASPALFTEK